VVLALMPEQALKVRFFVAQSQLAQFKVGDKVAVFADGVDGSTQAKIFHIARSAEFTPPVIYDKNSRQKLVFLVEARLPVGSQLSPGLPVDVALP
jgi:HlyD family secretion protein